jgi:hypothetical protein
MTARFARSRVELSDSCPYCQYRCTIVASDINGQLFSLRCFDCKQIFVIVVAVAVTHTVHGLADVDVDEVLDELGKPRRPAPDALPAENPQPPTPPVPEPEPEDDAPPRPRAKRSSSAEGSGSSVLMRSGREPLRLKVREVRGSRYGASNDREEDE